MTKPCECPVAGFCQRHNREKSRRAHELCQTRDDYRALWDQQLGQPVTPRPGPCKFLGDVVRKVSCLSCKGHVQLKVFECGVFGEATFERRVDGIATCAGCSRYLNRDSNW